MTVATDAPLDALRLRDIALRAVLGIARTGTTSFTSSGDLFIAFSTTHVYPRAGGISGPPLETDDERVDALFEVTADAAEEAVYDVLFSARTNTAEPDGSARSTPCRGPGEGAHRRVPPLAAAPPRPAGGSRSKN